MVDDSDDRGARSVWSFTHLYPKLCRGSVYLYAVLSNPLNIGTIKLRIIILLAVDYVFAQMGGCSNV